MLCSGSKALRYVQGPAPGAPTVPQVRCPAAFCPLPSGLISFPGARGRNHGHLPRPQQLDEQDAARQGRKRARSVSIASEEARPFVEGETDPVGAEPAAPPAPDDVIVGSFAAEPAAMALEDAEEAVMLQELEEFGICPRPAHYPLLLFLS